ncbi:unnamed protein product, partial [Strongylus vulgaris]
MASTTFVNVSAVIERQSVKVDGRGVLIQEVQYQEMPIDTEQETEKIRALEREKVNMENERFAIEDEMSSLRKRIEVLDGVAEQIASKPSSTSCTSTELPNMARRHTVIGSTAFQPSNQAVPSIGFLTNDDALSNLAKFLSYYGETVSNMKTNLRSRQREWDQFSEKIEALERQIDQLRCGYEYDSVRRKHAIRGILCKYDAIEYKINILELFEGQGSGRKIHEHHLCQVLPVAHPHHFVQAHHQARFLLVGQAHRLAQDYQAFLLVP